MALLAAQRMMLEMVLLFYDCHGLLCPQKEARHIWAMPWVMTVWLEHREESHILTIFQVKQNMINNYSHTTIRSYVETV
jgi:hypothetical protein